MIGEYRFVRGIPRTHRVDLQRQEMRGVESLVHVEQADDAPREQPRTDQQHERESHLRYHETGTHRGMRRSGEATPGTQAVGDGRAASTATWHEPDDYRQHDNDR